MPIPPIDPATFGFGGANMVPQGSNGKPWVGLVLEAQREDALWSRFSWPGVAQAVASDLASLAALVNVIVSNMYTIAPAGSEAFDIRNIAISAAADGALEALVLQANTIKAALIATAGTDYTALSGTPDATNLATAITLANAIRTALGIV